MKLLASLFLVVLAKGLNGQQNPAGDSESQNQHDREKISILKIDRTLTLKKYVDGAETFPPPTIEHGDCEAERFKKDFDRVVGRWGQEIDFLIHDEGVAAGKNLIDDVEDKYNKLVNSIGRSSKKDSENNNAERDLKYLVIQLNAFLDLKPGNQTIEHKALPKVPEQPTKIVSRTAHHTASDFFLHLPELLNEDMSSIYGYIAGIVLTGWHNSRKYFDIHQTQYRNQILNNWVLPAYRKVVEKVFENRDYIESCVSRGTWSSFENSGHLIIKISNDWLHTLAELEKYENSK